VQERRPPHPRNDLNELSGEEWLYFTKSVWSTAYPSELGHARRKAHGANKPPRLMARLIEFFTKSGELVLDPFAGVGGTLLGMMVLMAIFAPYLGTVDPQALSPIRRLRWPSAQYWFGTDMLGRDIYSRTVYGARVSLTVGISVALLASGFG